MLLRAWPVLFCFSFFYGIPGGGLSGVLGVTSVDPASFTLLDGVDPSPVVPCSGVGACCGACCVPPIGLPCVVPASRAPPTSAAALPPSFCILNRNRFRVFVWFPDDPPASPGPDFGAKPMSSKLAGLSEAQSGFPLLTPIVVVVVNDLL